MRFPFKLLLLLLWLGSGCASLDFGPSDECKALTKTIKQKWHFDTDTRLYSTSEIASEVIQYQSCLHGWNRGKIWQLLGNPSFRSEELFRYYLDEACFTGQDGLYLEVSFDGEGLARRLTIQNNL